MAGRNSSKSPHASSLAHVLKPIAISAKDWEWIESLTGYEFTQAKRDEIQRRLESISDWKDLSNLTPTNQDVKRTLTFLSTSDPDRAEQLYSNCDIETHGLIYSAAVLHLGLTEPYTMTGEIITKAAKLVLQDLELLPPHSGGRPRKSYQHELASYCRELWIESGNDPTIYQWDGELKRGEDFLEFCKCLFDIIEAQTPLSDMSLIDLLQKGKVFTL